MNTIKIGLLSMVVALSAVPVLVYAATPDSPESNPNFQIVNTDCGKFGSSGDYGPTQNGGNSGTFRECGWSDLLNLVRRIMNFVIYLSVSIAVLSFCYAGFIYLTAFGEMGKVEEAHKIFSGTIYGMIIILLAWLIVATILKTMGVGADFTILNIDNVQTITKPQ